MAPQATNTPDYAPRPLVLPPPILYGHAQAVPPRITHFVPAPCPPYYPPVTPMRTPMYPQIGVMPVRPFPYPQYSAPPVKHRRFRRRHYQICRKFSCTFPGCTKSYGSLNHLNTHIVTKKHGSRKSKSDFRNLDNDAADVAPSGASPEANGGSSAVGPPGLLYTPQTTPVAPHDGIVYLSGSLGASLALLPSLKCALPGGQVPKEEKIKLPLLLAVMNPL